MEISQIINAQGNEDFLEIIKCKICLQISLSPVICKKCESVFCKECLEHWTKKSKTCPFRCENLEIIEESRILKNVMSKFLYICDRCSNKIYLSDFLSHQKVCAEDLINCDYDCGEILKNSFKETHIKLFCPNTIIQCKCCKTKFKRKDFPETEGKENEKEFNRIKELENELKIKDEIISKYVAKNKELLEKKQGTSDSNKICPRMESNYIVAKKSNLIQKFNIKALLQKENSNNLIIINHLDIINYNNSNYLILSITNGDIIHYNLTQDKLVKVYNLFRDNITDMKILKNLNDNHINLITTSFDSNISSTNLITGEIQTKKLNQVATCILISITNDIIIIGDVAGFIRMLIIDGFEEIINKQAHNSRITTIQYTDNKEYLLSFAKDNSISITDLIGFNVIKSIIFDTPILSSVSILNSNSVYLTNDKGDIYSYLKNNRQIIGLQYQNNFKSSSSKLFTYTNLNETFLVLLNTLTGISFYKLNKSDGGIIPISKEKIEDISAMNIVVMEGKLEKENILDVIMSSDNNKNNLQVDFSNQNKMNFISSENSMNQYVIFTRKDGSLNAILLN